MATLSAIAKRTERRQIEILKAVHASRTEVTDLKAAIHSTALDIGQQTRQASIAIGSMADEIVNLKVEIAELQSAIAPPAATTRRTKK